MNIKDINDVGKEARGMRHFIRHLEGKELTQKQAIEANCYGCMGGYTDGKQDERMRSLRSSKRGDLLEGLKDEGQG
jgi:hypothetical protein